MSTQFVAGAGITSLEKLVYLVGKHSVPIGHDMAHIVRVQFYAHIAELVMEYRVVRFLLSKERHACHESESLLEVLEAEFPNEAIVLFHPHGEVLSTVKVVPRVGIQQVAPTSHPWTRAEIHPGPSPLRPR